MSSVENITLEDEIILDNQSDSDDIQNVDVSDVVVYARDWTIETIFNQIKIENIDLNPKFQRRNAWNDDKRSKLIESIIMGYPVPEIVLAENPSKKRSFVVIDGKQRLLTIAGFIDNDKFKYWDRPVLKGLKVLSDLNKLKYGDLDDKSKREFDNSSLRCTVITNFRDIQILYDIFYRLNSGSECNGALAFSENTHVSAETRSARWSGNNAPRFCEDFKVPKFKSFKPNFLRRRNYNAPNVFCDLSTR